MHTQNMEARTVTRKTQCERILAALKRGPLTSAQVAHRFNCYSFHRRLSDLRKRGHDIEGVTVQVTRSDGRVIRFKRYYLR